MNTIELKQIMKNIKIRKKPRSKQGARQSKKRIAKRLRNLKKRTQACTLLQEIELKPIEYKPTGKVDSYAYAIGKDEWVGMLTLKLHDPAYSRDTIQARKNRFEFLKLVMENLCNRTFRLKETEFNWVACEEFGGSGQGHVHLLFSFDHLKAKGREDKIPKIDFSNEKGEFFKQSLETIAYFWGKLGKRANSIDLNWRPMSENSGLVAYLCKLEEGRQDKKFLFSKFWEVHRGLKASLSG